MYNHNKAQQSKNRVHISLDILYVSPFLRNTIWSDIWSVNQHSGACDFRFVCFYFFIYTMLYMAMMVYRLFVNISLDRMTIYRPTFEFHSWSIFPRHTLLKILAKKTYSAVYGVCYIIEWYNRNTLLYSREMSAWPYRVTTKYSFYLVRTYKMLNKI